MKVLHDRPIEKPEADEFGRRTFAEAIAAALVLPPEAPSIVVAIEGEWGSGKTSVLNMIAHALGEHTDEPKVIPLDSWLLAGSENVIPTFLTQFAAKLGRNNQSEAVESVAKKVMGFSRLLTPVKLIPGVGPYASIAQDAINAVGEGAKAYAEISKLDIQKGKKEVAEALKNMGRAIVIILDDLDRLDPDETKQVFRLIKAVADFERVSYLLAYDPAPVHQALSFGGAYDGSAYLEKIVQVAYPLPLPGYLALKSYMKSRLDSLMEAHKIQHFEADRLARLLSKGGLVHVLRHPRDVNRLVNRLSISIPATLGEVNAADVVAFEAISVRFPNVALAIRKRPYEFVGGWTRHPEPLDADYMQEAGDDKRMAEAQDFWRRKIWEGLNPEDHRALKALLNFLFLGFAGETFTFDMDGRDENPEGELRVSNPSTLLKLLAVGPVSGTLSSRDVFKFLQEPAGRASLLDDLFDSELYSGWLVYAANFVDKVQVVDHSGLISNLMHKAKELAEADRASAYRSIGEMVIFTLQVLKALPAEESEKLFNLVAANELSISLSCEVVRHVAHDFGLRGVQRRDVLERNLIIRNRTAAEEGIEAWLAVVRKRAAHSFSHLLGEPDAVSILFRWGQLGSFDEVQEWVEQLTSTEQGILEFLGIWPESQRINDLHYFFKDWRAFKERCERHSHAKSFREDLWMFFGMLEAKERQAAAEGNSS